MKPKIITLGMIVVMCAAGVAYFLFKTSATAPTSPTEHPPKPQEQLQKGLQGMLTQKAEKKSLHTQLAVYEKLLSQSPNNPELQQHIGELRRRIKELEREH
jgi:hypothetical protein